MPFSLAMNSVMNSAMNKFFNLFPEARLYPHKNDQADWPSLFKHAAVLPALLLIIFIMLFVSRILYWDEWNAAQFIIRAQDEGLKLGMLWEPHNEHRIVLGRIAYYLNSLWNILPARLMIVSILIHLGIYEFLRRRVFMQIKFRSSQTWLNGIFIVTLSFFFFSPAQKQNFFWGFQIVWFFQMLGFYLAIHAALLRKKTFLVGAVFLGYLSVASWVSVLPIIGIIYLLHFVQAESQQKKLVLYEIVGFSLFSLFLFLAYVYGEPPSLKNHFFEILISQPYKPILFILQVLGSPFATLGRNLAYFCAICFIAATCFCFKAAYFRKRALEFYLVLLAFVSSLLICVGRVQLWTTGDFIADRYATLVIPGWLAIFVILLTQIPNLNLEFRKYAIIVLSVLTANIWIKGIGEEYDRQVELDRARTYLIEALKSDHPSDRQADMGHLYHNQEYLWNMARDLHKKNMFPF